MKKQRSPRSILRKMIRKGIERSILGAVPAHRFPPGEIITKYSSPEDREIIKELKSSDIEKEGLPKEWI